VPAMLVPSGKVAVAVIVVTHFGGVFESKQFTAVAKPDEFIVATPTSADRQTTPAELVMS
jgi:hypothetical protein